MTHLSRYLAHSLTGTSIFILFFFAASSVHAALPAPILADPVVACSGINPPVTLTWSAVSDATSYAVFRDGSSTPFATPPGTTVDDGAVNPTETHTYTVQAQSGTDASPSSNAKAITVPHCGTIVRLVSTACFASGPEIKISWDTLPLVSAYAVLRDGVVIASSLPASQTSYTDTTAVGGQSYIYAVRASWPGDTKDSQNDVSVPAPACPVTLVANGNCNAPGANATLSWNSLPGILSYEVFRNNSFLAPRSGISFDDSAVKQKLSYDYKVRALYANTIADSVTVPVTIPRCAPVLTTQNTCNAANTTIPEIKLSWSDTADATKYNITEAIKGFVIQLTGSPPMTNYTDSANIQNDSGYAYTIHAQGSFSPDQVSNAGVSNVASVVANCSVTTIPSPAPEVTVTPICNAGVARMSLSWTPANNVLYYTIRRTNNNSGDIAPPRNVTSNITADVEQDIELNTSYTYKIEAVGNGDSAPSTPVTKTSSKNCAPPGTPSLAIPEVSCINGQSTVDLSWTSSFNAMSYEVYQNGFNIKPISDPTITTYRDQSTTNATIYTYEIRAVGPGGTTSSGAPYSVMTPNCASPSAPFLTVGAPMCSGTPSITIPLSWTPSSNVLYYNVYRRRTGDPGFSKINSANVVATHFTDTGLAQNIPAVDYFIEAVGPMGTISQLSNQAGRSTPWCPPLTPTLSAIPWCVGNKTTINLAWSVPTGTSGLVAGYALDEASGIRANDVSGNNNAGMLLKGPTWATGKNAGALNFDGTDDYVNVPLFNGTGGATNNVTISAWIRPNAKASYKGILESRAAGLQGLLLSGATGNPLTYSWEDTGDEFNAATGLPLVNGKWYFASVVITPTAATVSLYDNSAGIWKTWTNAKTHNARTVNGTWNIGQDPGVAGRNWNGRIDDIRIYKRALTQAEIQADRVAPVGIAPLVTSYTVKKDAVNLPPLAPPTTNYTDGVELNAGQSYSYTITATGQGGVVTSNPPANATALNCTLPEAPSVTPMPLCNGSTPQMKLAWLPTANTISYDVFRGAAKLATILYNAATPSYSHTDTPLSANTAYTYTVVSNGPVGTGTAASVPASSVTLSCTPSQPATFTLIPQCSGTTAQYKMTWTDPTPSNTTSYEIRRDGDPTPVKILTVPTALSWTDDNNGSGFPASQSHSYTVTAVGPAGPSIASLVRSAISLDCSEPGRAMLQLAAPMCVGGTALSFDGTNDFVRIPNSPSLENVQEGNYTLAAWFKPSQLPPGTGSAPDAHYSIISKEGAHTGLRYSPNYFVMEHWLTGDVWKGVVTSASFPPGLFYHVAGVVDRTAGTIKIYVNGILQGTTAFTPNTAAREYGAKPWHIGIAYENPTASHAWPAHGVIDEVRIYNRVLSQAEILSQYNGGAGEYGVPGGGLVGGWHFEDSFGTATAAADYSGNNSTGALVNSPVWVSNPIAVKTGAHTPFVQVPMQWDATSNTTKYQVVRGSTVIATVPSIPALMTYNYSDTSYSSPANILTSNATHTYKIKSLNAGGGSTTSTAKTSAILPWCSPTLPIINASSPIPSCSAGKSSFLLTWKYGQPYANTSSFEVRRDGGSGMIPIANPPSSGTGSQSYLDTNGGAGLAAGTNYAYEIAAVGPSGLRTTSSSVSGSAISCAIGTLSKNSQCTSAPGIHPITLLTWPIATTGATPYALAKKEEPATAYDENYLTVNNYSAASPTAIRQWLILGTFPNAPNPTGFANDYIDADPNSPATEATIMPRAGETVNGKTWKELSASTMSDYVDLNVNAAFGAQTNVVGYAFAYIVNTGASNVSGQLRLGGDDGIKAFFNGDILYTFTRQTSSARDSQIVPVTLKPGINTLLMKVSQIGGGWGFWARLTDSSGNPLLPTITTTDSGVTKGVTSDYYVWSGSLIPSLVVTEVAPLCEVVVPSVTADASCSAGQGRITLTWPATANTTYYHVYRSSFEDMSGMTQLTVGDKIEADPSLLSYSYLDIQLEQNKVYYYSVEAVGNGSKFSSVVKKTSSVCAAAPDKPDLQASGVESLCAGTSPRITLDWPDAANAISYTVYRDNTALIPSVPGSAFTDQSGTPPSNILVADTTYAYKIQAVGNGGDAFSNPVAIEAQNCSGPPVPPDLNPPEPLSRSTHVYLSWKDNSINEDGFRIIREVTVASAARSLFANLFDFSRGPQWFAEVILNPLPADSVFTVDTTSQEDTCYRYEVEAYNSAGANRSNSEKKCVPILPPGSFTLMTSCVLGSTVNLDWTDAGTTLAGGPVTYNASWGTASGGSFTLMAPPCSADITSTSCSVAIPDPSALIYKVIAKNNGGTTEATVSTRCTNPRYEEVRPQ